MGDDSGLGGCQPMRWQRLALITGWLEGGRWWAPGTGREYTELLLVELPGRLCTLEA